MIATLTAVLIYQAWAQYHLENFDAQPPISSLNLPLINNGTYVNSLITGNFAITALGPHYSKVRITSIEFHADSFPSCMYEENPSIRLDHVFEKYLEKGAINDVFEIPIHLDIHPKAVNASDLSDLKLSSVPVYLSMDIYDYQFQKVTYNQTLIFSMDLTNSYEPKECAPEVLFNIGN